MDQSDLHVSARLVFNRTPPIIDDDKKPQINADLMLRLLKNPTNSDIQIII